MRVLATIINSGMFPIAPLVDDRWLAVDLDRWLRRGKPVNPTSVNRLIDLHIGEFVHKEPLRCVKQPAGAGYLLSHSQVILYCMLSRLPRAAQIREALIKTINSDELPQMARVI